MAFTKVEIHPINLESAKRAFEKYSPDSKESKAIMEHIRQLATGEVTGKPISEKRQMKLLHVLGMFFRHYKKSSSTITRDVLSKFKEDLLNDKILKGNGQPYSDSTKEDLTETLVRYLEWKYPKRISGFVSRTNRPLRKWFIIRSKHKTPEILTEAEVKKLSKESNLLWAKYAIDVLFGAGLRIEEFLNLRFDDIEEPTANFPYYKIDVKEEYSKTEGRKIGLYWEHCTKSIGQYLASIKKKDGSDLVLEKDYDTIRMYLSRLGKRVLGKRVNPHMFRKSSATFYAAKLNRQQLCVRFGWKFKSDMPDIYISRSGVDEIEVKDLMLNDDLSKLRKDHSEQQVKMEIIEKALEAQRKKFEKFIKGTKAVEGLSK